MLYQFLKEKKKPYVTLLKFRHKWPKFWCDIHRTILVQFSGLPRFKLGKFRLIKKSNNNISEISAEVFLARMKVKLDEGGGRILLGDNTGCGAVTLRPIGFRCVGFGVSAVLPCIYVYTWPHAYSTTTYANFGKGRALRNVTTAWWMECLYRIFPSGSGVTLSQ
jgi:hypothetical protein